jgi:hypothetical protein
MGQYEEMQLMNMLDRCETFEVDIFDLERMIEADEYEKEINDEYLNW